MKIVTSPKPYSCVACSLSMLLDIDLHIIERELFTFLDAPFPEPWDHLPKVPDMNVICDWVWQTQKVALMPFQRNPMCSPHSDCPSVPSWPLRKTQDDSAEKAWGRALSYGDGLLEGVCPSKGLGHMCTWKGGIILDPRGFAYSENIAETKFDFTPEWLWLAVKAYK